jgi:hypothetical protein
MKAGKVTAVLTSAGAVYGIWLGTKGQKGFWQTAGMALLFSFGGAALGTVYETVTTKDDTSTGTKPPATQSFAAVRGVTPTGKRHSASGTFGSNGYRGSNIALRNRNK